MEVIDLNSRVSEILSEITKDQFSKDLGISRPTLNSKIDSGKWKKLEIYQINKIYERVC